MTSQTERRALITGASSGIGRATALAFARSGIHLALVSRNRTALEQVAAQASDYGVSATIYPIDLALVEQVKTQIGAIADELSPDILVNSAGMVYTGLMAEMPLADWQQVMALNVTSVFQCIQAVLPGMRQRHRGTIINVASISAHQVFPEWGAYSVSKFGLLALSKAFAVEERQYGIRVMTISPGAVNTSIWDTETVHANFDRTQMLTPEVVAESILYAALLPEQAVIEEITVMPSAGAL